MEIKYNNFTEIETGQEVRIHSNNEWNGHMGIVENINPARKIAEVFSMECPDFRYIIGEGNLNDIMLFQCNISVGNPVKLNFIKANRDNVWEIADGIEFVELFTNKLIVEYTREQYKTVKATPKSGARYYVLNDGKKSYFSQGDTVALNKDGYLIKVNL